MKVLITGARAPVAVDLARSFAAAGHEAHLADCVMPWAARAMGAKLWGFPPPARDFAGFARAMAETAAHYDLVLPTCEEVFWLAAAATRDGWTERLFAPDLALLRRLHSKAEFPRLLAECGLTAPETQLLEAPPTAWPAPETWVFKPEFSRFATQTLIGPTLAQLGRIDASPARRWVAQRRLHGEEICSWAVVRSGRVLAHVAYRPRWRHGAAAAYAMEAVDCPAVKAIAQRIAEATGLTGQIAFDSIVDAQGRAWAVECNPRAVSGLHLFDASPALAEAIASGRAVPSPPAGRLRHMAPAMALLGVPAALRNGRLGKFIADWREGRDVIGRGQSAVLAGCLVDAARFAALGLGRRLSPAGATTDGIEWNGEPIA